MAYWARWRHAPHQCPSRRCSLLPCASLKQARSPVPTIRTMTQAAGAVVARPVCSTTTRCIIARRGAAVSVYSTRGSTTVGRSPRLSNSRAALGSSGSRQRPAGHAAFIRSLWRCVTVLIARRTPRKLESEACVLESAPTCATDTRTAMVLWRSASTRRTIAARLSTGLPAVAATRGTGTVSPSRCNAAAGAAARLAISAPHTPSAAR